MGSNKAGPRKPERGQYGNTRGKERQARRRRVREDDPRWQAAAEETRKAREDLEALIAQQAENPAVGETEGAVYARELKEREEAVALAESHQAELVDEETTELQLEDVSTLPVRPCAKVAKREEHPAHKWDRGGLKISTWCEGFTKRDEPVPVTEPIKIPRESEGKWQFAYTTARLMLKQGYNIRYVHEFTGIGRKELDDIPIDSDGYGIIQKDELEEDL